MKPDPRWRAAGIEVVRMTPRQAEFRFRGLFQGREVVWQARLLALDHPASPSASQATQYLEIGEPVADVVPIEIGLRIPQLDAAVLLKAAIMVRNYRRLRRGRHEWKP